MRIGVYGGTFNPIHLGHVHLIREFQKRLQLDRVILIPTGTPPHKQVKYLASAALRIEMCELACKEAFDDSVSISNIETRREGKSYTSDTLQMLKEQFPQDEIFFLMGEDMFLTLHNWVRPQVICDCATLCGALRSVDGMERMKAQKKNLEKLFSARCIIESISYLPISSTEIRARVAGETELETLVPKCVATFIRQHGLYRAEEEVT